MYAVPISSPFQRKGEYYETSGFSEVGRRGVSKYCVLRDGAAVSRRVSGRRLADVRSDHARAGAEAFGGHAHLDPGGAWPSNAVSEDVGERVQGGRRGGKDGREQG